MGEKWENGSATGSEILEEILAHDLSNYHTIILGKTDLLLAEVDDPDITERLKEIKRQAIAADALLQAVGGVARGTAHSGTETIDVSEIVTKEVKRLKSAYPEATIQTDIDGGTRAWADVLFTSVIANLLENAIEHNDLSSPHIHVNVSRQDDVASITIEDNGPGLPDEVRSQLEGRGLAEPLSGVHIVRLLVEKYGGTIAVRSAENGTAVTVELQSESE